MRLVWVLITQVHYISFKAVTIFFLFEWFQDSEWEEVQDLGDVDCKNLIYSTTSPSSVMPSIEQLEAMEKVLFEVR